MSADPDLIRSRHLELAAELRALDLLEATPVLARHLREYLYEAVAGGLDGCVATQLISDFNDRLSARVIDLTARRHRLPPVSWCWLALGSEGRHEQTFLTDQDNGLIFNAANAQEAAPLRQLFLPFAQEVNQRLADCGFALCNGQVMAGNPAWCLSVDEWRQQFIDWVRRPEPMALLHASIFFDLRPLFGALELGEQLRSLLLSMTVATPAFLHLMAVNALQAEVPLNFRGELAVDDNDAVDLKKFGSRIFVDAARIFALASGARAVNTADRLAAAGAGAGLQDSEVASARAAFGHVLRLRLAHQSAAFAAGRLVDYRLKPADLNEMDRVILREALKQAKRLQQRLKLNYSL